MLASAILVLLLIGFGYIAYRFFKVTDPKNDGAVRDELKREIYRKMTED